MHIDGLAIEAVNSTYVVLGEILDLVQIIAPSSENTTQEVRKRIPTGHHKHMPC